VAGDDLTAAQLNILSNDLKALGGGGLEILRSGAVALDFPSVAANGGVQTLTVTVTGAAVGDDATVHYNTTAGLPNGCVTQAIVSATDTVTVRITNCTSGAIDPPNATVRVNVFKFH
jgi:hypothetical protein